MTYNCLITIKKVTGSADNKSFTTLASNVRAFIVPVTNEILALYPDLPAGQSYTFVINSDYFSDIPAESEFTVSDAMGSELANNDSFTVVGITRKNKIMRNLIHSGTCVKKEVEA